ncbi:MAG: RNA polymerase sigma factor RpoE [Hahellaceae bacterium]|nr:RNA polymerase sigma factor RpoE [Hahellaceae bacterium]
MNGNLKAEDEACDVDSVLVQRVQRGDRRAFDFLVAKYQARVLSLIARYVREPQDVRDVAQEAFVKAYRSIGLFRGDSAFYTWLYRIAVNAALNFLSSHARQGIARSIDQMDEEPFALGDALTNSDSPETELEGQQLKQQLDLAIQALPEELRQALLLREYDGLSYEEIADVLQCPIGTVRSRIFRARDQVMAATGIAASA